MALRLAIISASRIVEEFLSHIAEIPEVEATVLCCRPQSEEKARALAARYGVGRVCTDEAALLRSDDFDAVYIATANHLHYATAKRTLAAGRHTILEKPFTATKAETEELFALADAKGVYLFEAITTPYLPQYKFMQEKLAQIGPVRGAMASFCARSRRYDDFLNGIWNTTFDPACLGGALNDMNLYNLHLLAGLLGMPQSCEYRPTRAANGIDTAGLALLHYPQFTATAFAAKDSRGENGCILQGPDGYLEVRGGSNAMPEVFCLLSETREGGTKLAAPAPQRFRMAYEFAEFARILAEDDRPAEAAARQRTLNVMQLLDDLKANSK